MTTCVSRRTVRCLKLDNLRFKAATFAVALFVLGSAWPALSDESYPFKQGEDWIGYLDYWKTLSPDTVLEADFYKAEYALIAGNSGSGGYFLDREEIAWIAKSVRSLKKRGIPVKDSLDRRTVFRNSFWHLKRDQSTA
jgi:hypothetical protein